MSDGLVQILEGNTFVVSDDSGDIEASQHRPDRAVLLRHPVPVAVGADGQRRAAQRAVHRRPAVLRDPVLPGAGHRHASTSTPTSRSSASGRSATASARSCAILNHDERAGRPRPPDRRGERLRRPVRGQGRAQEEGRATVRRGRDGSAAARLPAGDLRAGDLDLLLGTAADRRARASLRPSPCEPHGEWDDRARRRDASHGPAAGTSTDQVRGRTAPSTLATWPADLEKWLDRRAERELRLTSRSSATYRRSLIDLAALRFSPLTCRARRCPPPACPGS